MKEKYAFWLEQETKEEIRAIYTEDNCRSQSEFVEKARTSSSSSGRHDKLPTQKLLW